MVKLEDYNVKELKSIISKYNKKVKFPSYSKMKRTELISLIRDHKGLKVIESDDPKKGIKIIVKTGSIVSEPPKLKVSKKKLVEEINKEVDVNPTKDKKGVEVIRKDGKNHSLKDVDVLKKEMPNADIKLVGKKLVIKPKEEMIKPKEEVEATGKAKKPKMLKKKERPKKEEEAPKKKERSEKQKANDKRLGEMAKKKQKKK